MLKLVILLAFMLTVTAVLKEMKKGPSGRSGPNEKPRPRMPLTLNEQPMYFRLIHAFPNHVVLAQVPFSSVLTATSYKARNTFDRKVADFAICTRAFEIVTFIELDDSSHKGREIQDAARDKLLTDCGYAVIRYKTVPDVEQLRRAVAEVAVKALANGPARAA